MYVLHDVPSIHCSTWLFALHVNKHELNWIELNGIALNCTITIITFRITHPTAVQPVLTTVILTHQTLLIHRSAKNFLTVHHVRGDADKSLARPTSRCLRTESIVSLERGICSCAELQVISCYRGWKEACQATRDFNNMETRAVIKFIFHARQGAEGNSRHSDRNIMGTCTMVCHRQRLSGPA